jgi:hypothetical protein
MPGHRQERVMAGGTIAAVDWVVGDTPRRPWTRREVSMPTLADIGVQNEAVLQAKVQAENRVHFATTSAWLTFCGTWSTRTAARRVGEHVPLGISCRRGCGCWVG